MKATVYYAPHDVRLESVPDPTIVDQRDAIVRVTRAAICGSDLWYYRGITQRKAGIHPGHEFVGIVGEVGSQVRTLHRGDAVVAPFAWSDGTCEYCMAGLQTACKHGGFFGTENGGQAEFVRVPYADGTLVKLPESITGDGKKLDAAVALSDALGTGYFGVRAADTTPDSTVVVVGDGAVGLCAVLAAVTLARAGRVIAVGHNANRLALAKRFGAAYTFDSHDPGVKDEIVELTRGGAPHVVEAVGNQESLELAVNLARPGASVGLVGVPHGVENAPLATAFYNLITLRGGPAPVRAFLPKLIEALAEGYAAMDERRAIKAVLRP